MISGRASKRAPGPKSLAPLFLDEDPAKGVLPRLLEEGFAVLGRHKEGKRTADATHWLFEPGLPPSYSAAGRLRFALTLRDALAFQPKRVLEVAAGGGLLSACLAEPGRRVVLNDLRDMSGEVALWDTGEPLEFVQGNLLELDPKKLGTFDLVIACDVIEHVARGDAFLAQLRKFVSPGGNLLLTTPNGAYFRNKLPTYSQVKDFTEAESRQFKPDADGHLFLYTRAELEKVARDAGFLPEHGYFSVTPWMSGQGGFRILPSTSALVPFYVALDRMSSGSERFCAQLTLHATV